MRLAKPKAFASKEREREVCGTVCELKCGCGGALNLFEGAYKCAACGIVYASLLFRGIKSGGRPRLGPFSAPPTTRSR